MANKVILTQAGDGTAIPSNMVGGLALDVANSAVVATFGAGAATIATGNLTQGNYLILCEVSGYNDARPSSGIGVPDVELLVNSVSKSRMTQIALWPSVATIGEAPTWTAVMMGYATVMAGATHSCSVLLTAVANSGTPTNFSCGSRASGRLRAIRIG
jgi:hypothetical protein